MEFYNVSFEDLTNKSVFANKISSNDFKVNRTYRLYMWIGDEVLIGGGDGLYDYDMETWNNKVYASVKVSVNADFVEKNITIDDSNLVTDSKSLKRLVNNNYQDTTYIDNDGTIYFSGTNDVVNYNYVLYSGILWRITAIYSDRTMKMITDEEITNLNWGEKSTISDNDLTSAYGESNIRKWLNKNFLDTLYNYENIIVTNYEWEITTDNSKPPKKYNNKTTVKDSIGLLSAYEYYQSSRLSTDRSNSSIIGYLDNSDFWWLITAKDSLYVHNAGLDGGYGYHDRPNVTYGVRPVVVLLPDIKFSDGDGSYESPYKITGDTE